MKKFFKWLNEPVPANQCAGIMFMAACFAIFAGAMAGPLMWALS